MNWRVVSEAVTAGVLSGVIISLFAYWLHWFCGRGKARQECIRQLVDVLEERACLWLDVLRNSNQTDQERAMNMYSVKYRLFFIVLRRLKAVLNKKQNEALAANCLNVVTENPPGTQTPQEIEHLLENLKRLYASQS